MEQNQEAPVSSEVTLTKTEKANMKSGLFFYSKLAVKREKCSLTRHYGKYGTVKNIEFLGAEMYTASYLFSIGEK